MTALILAALASVNLFAVLLFRSDKRAAGTGARRMPERLFLTLAAVGAAPGLVWATYRFRHKTRKEPFRTLLRLILAAQIGLIVVAVVLIL